MLKLNSCLMRLGTLTLLRRFTSTSAQAVDSLLKKVVDENGDIKASIVNSRKPTGLVAAAFANLNNDDETDNKDSDQSRKTGSLSYFERKKQVEDKINSATDVQTILSVVDTDLLSRKHALKIVSILSEWSNSEKISVPDFENDVRFVKLCRILGKQRSNKNIDMQIAAKNSEDLNTVISIAGDDEAARLVANLNEKQMIKVMSTLAQKKRRSPTLLRTLSYHICKCPNTLDLKSCSDLLFSMATLNYPDVVLIDKINSDIQEKLPENKEKSSVLGSIATSLGILKCKDRDILDLFTDWMVEHQKLTRVQDIAALTMTLGAVGYSSMNVDKLPKLSPLDFSKVSLYLDYIWSLVVLNMATNEQLTSVLNPEFIESLKVDQSFPPSILKKLLNVNSYAVLMKKDYKGPFLRDDITKDVTLSYSKEKLKFISSLLDTLKSLLSSDANLKTACNSKMGFLYDAECILDSKCYPYPVDSLPPKGKKVTKIAMLGLEYHDLCRQSSDPVGSIGLYKQLLEALGYKVLLVPHTEYSTRDKLVSRVQYIERKLKELVQSSDSSDTKLK